MNSFILSLESISGLECLCLPAFPRLLYLYSFSLFCHFKLLVDINANHKFILNIWLASFTSGHCTLLVKGYAVGLALPALPFTSLWPWISYLTSVSFSFPSEKWRWQWWWWWWRWRWWWWWYLPHRMIQRIR